IRPTKIEAMIHDRIAAGPATPAAESTANSQPEPIWALTPRNSSWVSDIDRCRLRSAASNSPWPRPSGSVSVISASLGRLLHYPTDQDSALAKRGIGDRNLGLGGAGGHAVGLEVRCRNGLAVHRADRDDAGPPRAVEVELLVPRVAGAALRRGRGEFDPEQ